MTHMQPLLENCGMYDATAGCKTKFLLKLKHIYTAAHQNRTRRFLLRLLKSPQINIQILLTTTVNESGQQEVNLI